MEPRQREPIRFRVRVVRDRSSCSWRAQAPRTPGRLEISPDDVRAAALIERTLHPRALADHMPRAHAALASARLASRPTARDAEAGFVALASAAVRKAGAIVLSTRAQTAALDPRIVGRQAIVPIAAHIRELGEALNEPIAFPRAWSSQELAAIEQATEPPHPSAAQVLAAIFDRLGRWILAQLGDRNRAARPWWWLNERCRARRPCVGDGPWRGRRAAAACDGERDRGRGNEK